MVRRSTQREAVWDALTQLDHPTADEVFHAVRRDMPRVSLATVYRNLSHFVETGKVRMREIGGQNRYDVNVDPHIHVHDTETDRLIDVPMTDALRTALDDIAAQWLESHEDSIVEIRGRTKTG